jgi:hypothetical protein
MRATSLVLLLHLLLAGCEVSLTSGDEDVLTDPGPEAEREEALALAQRFLALLDAGAVDEPDGWRVAGYFLSKRFKVGDG